MGRVIGIADSDAGTDHWALMLGLNGPHSCKFFSRKQGILSFSSGCSKGICQEIQPVPYMFLNDFLSPLCAKVPAGLTAWLLSSAQCSLNQKIPVFLAPAMSYCISYEKRRWCDTEH